MKPIDHVFRQAIEHHRSGDLVQAVDGYLSAIAHLPGAPEPRRYLAIALMDSGQRDLAVRLLRGLVVFDVSSADYCNLLGNAAALHDPGTAERWFARAVRLTPGNGDHLYDLLRCRLELGDGAAAFSVARALAALRPADPQRWSIAAEAARLDGRTASALLWQRTAMVLDPADVRSVERLGALAVVTGADADAYRWLMRCLRLQPDMTEPLPLLATTLSNLGQGGAAARVAACALVAAPADPGAWIAYATSSPEDVVSASARAVRSRPSLPEAWNALGVQWQRAGRPGDAVRAFRTAVTVAPGMAPAWNNLATAQLTRRDFQAAAAAFGRAGRLTPGSAVISSNALFGLNYDPDIGNAALAEAHRDWGAQALATAPRYDRRPLKSRSSTRLTIGFISPDLKRHPVGYFLLPLLRRLDRARFQSVCYSDTGVEDDMTAELRANAAVWRNVQGLSDPDVASLIAKDDVDILIDLAGHTAGNRLTLFAGQAAPLQVSWLGYFHSTGLPTVAAVLTDVESVPPAFAGQFVEDIVHLPAGRLCYAPPDYAPDVGPPPMMRVGYPTFGSFNNLAKLTPDVVALWAGILHDCPSARLVLKWHSLADGGERAALWRDFEGRGVSRDRVELRRPTQHASMLAEYDEIDVALDPFPFTGCLTTCEALWMGVPVVTLEGERPVARQGVAFLSRLGRRDLVARTAAEYRAIATGLVADAGALTAARFAQRETMRARLCDGRTFAQGFERALLELWMDHGLA